MDAYAQENLPIARAFVPNVAEDVFAFPKPLAQKYQPMRIADFIGLEKPRKILATFARAPKSCALLFKGPSGTGKTTMALALAEEISAELIHIPSQHCTVAELEQSLAMTQYVPMAGKRFWLVLIDEFDQASEKAQLALLSKLDATGMRAGVVFIFTANSTDNLEARLLSRCMCIEFSSYGLADQISNFLASIWERETQSTDKPDFTRIAKDERNNIRGCLNRLELSLMEVS
jgi:replication-associated recombination protein RarA